MIKNSVQMVKLHLRKQEVIADDSYNLNNIADLAVSQYWFLLLEIFNGESFSINFIKFTKKSFNKFFVICSKNQLIQILEEQIFRKIQGKKKFDDIVILAKKIENQDFQKFICFIEENSSPYFAIKTAREFLQKKF